MKILLADDDYNFGYVLKNELEEHRFIVDMVSNGVDAILKLMENEYGFILVDIKMPRLNGLDTMKIIEALRTSRAINPQTQVILFSGENDNYREEAMRSGAIKYISKPFNIEALTQFIKGLSELPD